MNLNNLINKFKPLIKEIISDYLTTTNEWAKNESLKELRIIESEAAYLLTLTGMSYHRAISEAAGWVMTLSNELEYYTKHLKKDNQ